MSPEQNVVIAGGGWAGLAAAVELSSHGVPVTVLESARQLGGRARRLELDASTVDNGQHLFIGAYRETLRLLERMGVDEKAVFQRRRLDLRMMTGEEVVRLRAPLFPAPLHLAWALARARGLTMGERMSALRLALRLSLARFEISGDRSVAALLRENAQGPRLIERLWTPICLATLNVGPDQASARLFLRVLRDAFSRRRGDSDLLFQSVDLYHLFPEPARAFIERQGGRVHLSTRVTELRVEQGRMAGLTTHQGPVNASTVILAVPPWTAADLLEPWVPTRPIARTLRNLQHTPVATVYLQYAPDVRLPYPMVGLLGKIGQWVFDRRYTGQDGLMAVVISGPGAHMAFDKEQLAARVAQELQEQFGWQPPGRSHVVREKRAVFLCDVGVEAKRPGHTLPVEGLHLAGDFTATGYPATLEGAVRSGVQCARLILNDIGIRPTENHHEQAP